VVALPDRRDGPASLKRVFGGNPIRYFSDAADAIMSLRLSRGRRRGIMDRYIHRENLALLRKRLAETPDEATRKIILKLLAEEEAKDLPPASKP
jgi:hypothetical protein